MYSKGAKGHSCPLNKDDVGKLLNILSHRRVVHNPNKYSKLVTQASQSISAIVACVPL